MINMLDKISKKVSYEWSTKEFSEDKYLTDVVDPIITAFVGESVIKNTVPQGNDHELEESKNRKILQAIDENESSRCKPGRSLEIKIMKKHIFLCEVKVADKRPGLVKLAFMMKNCSDAAVIDGINTNEYAIAELLVEGRSCTLYSMTLTAPKVYSLIKVDVFFLPTSNKDYLLQLL